LAINTWALIPKKDYKPKALVLTDISNEPDDAESLVRLLVYTNEIDVRAIVATTSNWLNHTIHDEDLYPVLNAYEKVHPNLLKHSKDYPTADYFRSIIYKGKPVYGLSALEDDELSSGAKVLINEVDKIEAGDDYLYILVWGGVNVLAESLNHIKKTRSAQETSDFISKISVYSISDQDNSGSWIRTNFPKLRYIASVHAMNHYGNAAWVGISGDVYYKIDKGGPDTSLVSKEWIRKYIQDVGPLGKAYLDYMFIMEGDSPSTFSLIPNGLNIPSHPEYGGWGGRYDPVDTSLYVNHFADSQDTVLGKNGRYYTSNKATIWRWRKDYQRDFAIRMQWTIKSFEDAVHEPIINSNGTISVLPYEINSTVGSKITLDLSKSYDLNMRSLEYEWIHYREVTATQVNLLEVPEIEIRKLNGHGSIVEFDTPPYEDACLDIFKSPAGLCKQYHIIARVTNDAGATSYRRFVIKTQPDRELHERVKNQQQNLFGHDEL